MGLGLLDQPLRLQQAYPTCDAPWEVCDLQPNTEYSFVLMNRGSSAGGLQHLVSIRTAPDLLPHKPLPASAFIACTWGSEDSLWETVLTFHHVGPRD